MEGTNHLCMICGHEFKSEKKLEQHNKVAHEVKWRECTECHLTFETQQKFNNHMKVHKTRIVKCKV